MKSLVRWSATAGLVGSALMGSFLVGTLQALAIPQEQIIQKLRPVPVFTIANAQGAPLVASPPTGQKGPAVAGVFINQKDAQDFLNNLKTKNPDLAKNVKVVPVSLAEVYQLNQTNKGKPEQLDFAYVPSKQQVDTAVSLLKQQGGQQPQQFNGTPLFVARGGKDKGYLTIQQDGKSIIPMFFNKEELQNLLDRFKQQQPNMASSIEVQVLNLEGLMEVLRTKDDPQLNQIVLVPPQKSIEFIKSITPQQGAPAPATNKPAAAPAPKK
ncbi:Tic22 family protein [Stenomitos frigidus]|uniref:Tic22 family protein n=1 Tax=Stenomitos frigidus ULC18 TaxID=2107698 RepID=A0A2T1DX76_9CYAN|nr:Tic22 family protein [Stenomitos frigidus]PSB25041.1 hypothetical protein C7B82_24520 [Stenomitos frigidus ULC18]